MNTAVPITLENFDLVVTAVFIFLENFDPVVTPCRYGGVCGTEARFVR